MSKKSLLWFSVVPHKNGEEHEAILRISHSFKTAEGQDRQIIDNFWLLLSELNVGARKDLVARLVELGKRNSGAGSKAICSQLWNFLAHNRVESVSQVVWRDVKGSEWAGEWYFEAVLDPTGGS